MDRPASEQATISMGFPAPPRTDPQWATVRMLSTVLGGGASSRLFLELRERRGLTYGAGCGYDAGRYGGDLTVNVSCSTTKAEEALDALLAEIRRIGRESATEHELEIARRALLGGLPMAASSLGGLASLFGTRWLFELPEQAWSRLGEDLAAVGPEQLQEAAQRFLDPDSAHCVVVGRAEALEAPCARLGRVRVEPLPAA